MTDENRADLDMLTLVSTTFSDSCLAIDGGEWDLPTPCSEWNLGQLVDHVSGGNRCTVRILGREKGPEALAATIQTFGEADNRSTEVATSTERQLEAFNRAGALDETCSHLERDLSGRELLRIRIHEMIIHTWDVVETIHPPAVIPDEAVAELKDPESLTAQHFGILNRRMPIADSHRPQEVLLAAFGHE